MLRRPRSEDFQPTGTKRVVSRRTSGFPCCCQWTVIPEGRAAFKDQFLKASKEIGKPLRDGTAVPNLCGIPISWVGKAYECDPFQLRLASDMFPSSWTQSKYLNEFYVMDVILNRRTPLPGDTLDPEVVCPFLSYEPGDNDDEKDYLFRAAILFLPQSGVFYCHRERRKGDVVVANTFIAHDISWLRLQRDVTSVGGVEEVRYSFGSDGYVKRFYHNSAGNRVYNPNLRCWKYVPENHSVSAWRINTGRTLQSQQNRVIHRAVQSHDADGPMLAPDLLEGEERIIPGDEKASVPHVYLAAYYRNGLATSPSAKLGGRYYVSQALHYQLPDTCWEIDPEVTHNVDVVIDVDAVGETRNRQSVVMMRNVLEMDAFVDDNLVESADVITQHNKCLRERVKKGTPRTKCGDLGTMHAIGTRVAFDNVT